MVRKGEPKALAEITI